MGFIVNFNISDYDKITSMGRNSKRFFESWWK